MTTTKLRRRFFLVLFACACLCGGAVSAQTPRGSARPAAAPPQQGARAVENVTAPAGWKRYEIHYAGGGVMRVVLPGQPEVSSDKIPMGKLRPATQHIFTTADDKGVYVVGYIEGLPAALTADPGIRASFFNGLWKGMAEGMSNELKKNGVASEVVAKPLREVRVSGQQAQVQDFTVGKLAGSARAVLTGANSYLLVHISFADTINDSGNAFINSFELRPRR